MAVRIPATNFLPFVLCICTMGALVPQATAHMTTGTAVCSRYLTPSPDGPDRGFSRESLVLAQGGDVHPGPASPPVEGPPLVGTTWRLTELQGRPAVTPDRNAAAHLTLGTERKLSGSTGCNRFFGTYETASGRLKLNPAGMTMMACPEPLMEQEQAFIRALGTVTGYTRDGATLILLSGDQPVARFDATSSP